MNRATLIRGIQLIVVITLLTFAYLIYDGIREQKANLSAGLADVRPGWLLLATLFALQEGVFGGVRVWVLGRVLLPALPLRTSITSEFVLMFCSGVTPGQSAGPPTQAAVLVGAGMSIVNAATTEFVIASCTIVFFLTSAVVIFALQSSGLLVVQGGSQISWLLGFTIVAYCSALIALILGAAYPPLLKGMLRFVSRLFSPLWRALLRVGTRTRRFREKAAQALTRPGAFTAKLAAGIDDCHEGFGVYIRRGKGAYGVALLLTVLFFWSRFTAAYFILRGLGIPTTPSTFVTVGPPVLQVILIQSLLNFALYLSPTPGASGIAEAGSNALMSPWVKGAYELPYLVLWRLLTLFLCMFVGGVYVFRYLGADVLEKQVKDAEAAKHALEQARLTGMAATGEASEGDRGADGAGDRGGA